MFRLLATIALPAAPIAMIVSQAIPDVTTQTGVDLGAFGILIWALWYLLAKELPRQRAEFRSTLDKVCDRHEKWEDTRHADSVSLHETLHGDSARLNETLEQMRANCYEARMELKHKTSPHDSGIDLAGK